MRYSTIYARQGYPERSFVRSREVADALYGKGNWVEYRDGRGAKNFLRYNLYLISHALKIPSLPDTRADEQ